MPKIKPYLILGAIIALGLALRIYHNLDISLWHDEAFSALLIKYPWGEMIHRIGLDVHPPAYYIALRLWDYLFGDSLVALRGFSVFFGLGTVLAGYALVKTTFKSDKVALFTALFIAVSPFQIQYALEARMYTFGAFLAVLGTYFLVKILQSIKEQADTKKTAVFYLLFSLSVIVMILTHYYLLFTAMALCFYALVFHTHHFKTAFKKYGLLLASYALIIIGFLPWLKWFLYQYKQVGAGYWIPPMDKWSIPTTLWQMFVGIGIDIAQLHTQILVILTSLLFLFIVINFIRKTTVTEKWLFVMGLLAPFGGALLFALLAKIKGEDSSVYLVRYFLYASPFFLAIIAVWLTNLKNKKFAYLLLILYVGANLGSFANYWQDLKIQEKPGMKGAVELLKNNVKKDDHLVVGSSFEFFNLKYYINQIKEPWGSKYFCVDDQGHCKDRNLPDYYFLTPKLYSGGQTTIENIPHFAGTAILTNQDLLPHFEEIMPGGTVWLLWTNGFGGSKPKVPDNWLQIDEQGFAEVRPYVGTWVIVTKYQIPQASFQAN